MSSTEVVCPACRTRVPLAHLERSQACPRCRAPLHSRAASFAPPISSPGPGYPSPAPPSSTPAVAAPSAPAVRADDPPEVAAARQDPKRVLGRFVLLSELGKGGMGVVHRAWDDRLRRLVALKTILGDAADAGALERFQREAEAAARLRHPNIVAVHEVGEAAGRRYIAMELIQGDSLDKRLAKGAAKRLGFVRGIEVVRDVARAVQHAHDQGVIHRDLKPQNVLVDAKDRPYVLDFGLARLREGKSGLTRSSAAIGTPAYMPPEQAEGAGKVADERSDVYSLGATLYHVLAGRAPFEGATEVNVITALLTTDAAPPSRWNKRAAGDLDTIVLRCLEKEPERRYASASELADELDRYLAGDAIAARPMGFFERQVRRARRQKLAAALALATTVSVLAASGLAMRHLVELRRLEAKADAEREKNLAQERILRTAAEKAGREASALLTRVFAQHGELSALLARVFVQRAERSTAEGRHGEAVIFAAKALSMPELLKEDAIAARVALAIARDGPWRHPHTAKLAGRPVFAVAWSPRGDRLAFAGEDGVLRLCDPAQLDAPVASVQAHKGAARTIAWNADGSRIATGGDDGTVQLVDPRADSLRPLALPGHRGRVLTVAFSPDGRLLASGGEDMTLRLWDSESGAARQAYQGYRGIINAIAWRGDGGAIASGGFDQLVGVLDLAAGTLGFQHHQNGEITRVAWVPGQSLLATSSVDKTIAIFRTSPSLAFLFELRDHDEAVNGLSWTADGRRLATCSSDGAVRLVDPHLRRVEALLDAHSLVHDVAIAPEGRRLAIANADGTGAVFSWDKPLVRTLELHATEACSVAFSPDGRTLASGGWDKVIRLCGVERGEELRVFSQAHDHSVDVLAFLGGARIVSSSWDNRVMVRSTTSEAVEAELEGTCAAPSPDGRWLACSGKSGGVTIRDARNGFAASQKLDAPGWISRALAFDRDGRRLAVASRNDVLVYDVASWRRLVKFTHVAEVSAIAWEPSGKRIASGAADHAIRVWEADGAREVLTLKASRPASANVAWSPNGRFIASGGLDPAIRLWSAETGRLVASLAGHHGAIRGLAWSPDGKTLASASGDGRVKLWPVERMVAAPPPDVFRAAENDTGLTIPEGAVDPVPVR